MKSLRHWLMRGGMVLLLLAIYNLWRWDTTAPRIVWEEAPRVVGRDTRLALQVHDQGRGLRELEVALIQKEKRRLVVSESYPSAWPWQEGQHERALGLSPETSLEEIAEGVFWLEVTVRDHPNLWIWNRETVDRRRFELDVSPPRIAVLSGQHYIRQGGSEAIVYRVSEPVRASGVQVGDLRFHGYPLQERGENVHICLFALGYDQPEETSLLLWAEDAAGNRAQTGFWKKIVPVRFRGRDIHLRAVFMEKVVAEILPRTDAIERGDDLLQNFLKINGELRDINHRQIEAISRQSMDHLLWREPFLQLSNSQVESAFADRRTYYYQGRPVDQQTHLGFDLASLAQSPVEAANDGIVVFADYLGIYGNCVLVDHGLGLISLYGHLSRIDVQKGEAVTRGQPLGRTGETGLAGGDHLHFSLILQGTPVNPLEWWDPRWVERHILDRVGERGEP